MDTIIRYEDNGSVRYDGRESVESLSKVRRKKERDWSATDRRECHDEDEVARLEDRGC